MAQLKNRVLASTHNSGELAAKSSKASLIYNAQKVKPSAHHTKPILSTENDCDKVFYDIF